MKTYYDILEIEKTADESQIKRAYFRLVRKYAPERFPEEFKQLRAAYETLSDAKSREEYDKTDNLPGEAAFLYSQAQKARREGRISDVSEILTIIVRLYPQLQNIWIELAQSYEREDKIGKAIKVWEELGELYPTSGAYSYELALAYGKRGWHKKALACFERAVELDPHHAQAWMELIEFYDEAEDYAKIKQLRY
ncbi:MAG: DnaJ domain-containing protein, partial [Clostridiales bacterium]|nr:DnaJ domain-containing protein [Clostridiales bacterium]